MFAPFAVIVFQQFGCALGVVRSILVKDSNLLDSSKMLLYHFVELVANELGQFVGWKEVGMEGDELGTQLYERVDSPTGGRRTWMSHGGLMVNGVVLGWLAGWLKKKEEASGEGSGRAKWGAEQTGLERA